MISMFARCCRLPDSFSIGSHWLEARDSVLDEGPARQLDWLVEGDQVSGDRLHVSAHAHISRAEVLRDFASRLQRLDGVGEGSAVEAGRFDEAFDLTSVLEVIEHERNEGHLVFSVLGVDRDESNDCFSRHDKHGCARHHQGRVVLEVLRDGTLFEDVFVAADIHHGDAQIGGLLPAIDKSLSGQGLLDSFQVVHHD